MVGWSLAYIYIYSLPHRFLTHWDTQHIFCVGIVPVQAQGSKNKWMYEKRPLVHDTYHNKFQYKLLRVTACQMRVRSYTEAKIKGSLSLSKGHLGVFFGHLT